MDTNSRIMNCTKTSVFITILFLLFSWISGLSVVRGQQALSASQSAESALIKGMLIDIHGNTVPNTLLILFNSPTGMFTDTLRTNEAGYFRSIVPPGQYTISGTILSGCNALDIEPTSRIVVSAGDSVAIILNIQHGRGLTLNNVQFNGGEPLLRCAGNTEFTVTFSYQIWASYALPFGDEHLSIGIGPDMKGVHRIGTPGNYPGVSGNATFRIRAPERAGSYTLYAHQSSISDNTDEAIASYYHDQWTMFTDPAYVHSLPFIPIGNIEVNEPTGALSGQIAGRAGFASYPLRLSFLSSPLRKIVDALSVAESNFFEVFLVDGAYTVRGEYVADMTSYLLESQETITVSAPDTARFNLNFTDGTSLTVHDASSGGTFTEREVEAGELVELTCDYELHVGSDQQHDNQYIAVGIEGSPQDVRIIRRHDGDPVIEGQGRFKVQAPLEAGTYQVYAMLMNGFMTRDALDAYADRFEDVDFCYIWIGTITVREDRTLQPGLRFHPSKR